MPRCMAPRAAELARGAARAAPRQHCASDACGSRDGAAAGVLGGWILGGCMERRSILPRWAVENVRRAHSSAGPRPSESGPRPKIGRQLCRSIASPSAGSPRRKFPRGACPRHRGGRGATWTSHLRGHRARLSRHDRRRPLGRRVQAGDADGPARQRRELRGHLRSARPLRARARGPRLHADHGACARRRRGRPRLRAAEGPSAERLRPDRRDRHGYD